MAGLFACPLFRLRASRRDGARRGVTAVEFALLAPVFFLMLMGITETCLMWGAQQMLESAAFNTTRLAKTGYTGSGQTQQQTLSQILGNELQTYGNLIDTSKVTMTAAAYNSFSSASNGGGASGYGTQDQIVVYTITYPWKLFTPIMSNLIGTNGVVDLTADIVVRNEPYG
ncbi:MAG: pilus assembly protein [Alphaproteobacteria bacterium]|nr:pilus assembly protein [Alphaproteobacteria bacterium]